MTLESFSLLICMTAAKAQRDAFSDHWRKLCEERGNPIPKRRPSTFRFRPVPNVHDEDAAEFV